MVIRLIFSFIGLLSVLLVNAQTSIYDNNPASLKWKQINTPGFKVIFPENYESQAQRVANRLEQIRKPETQTMGGILPKKISIILQNQNSISNGFVTLGPRRSEFYTTPPQNQNFIGTNKWMDLLAIHEYRHIVQFEHSRTGWNKLFSILLGQNTWAGMAFSAAPPWFWEGDATLMETIYTSGGRGRIPAFSRIFRASLLEGQRWNYHKQHLRSYKHFVPDQYPLGYFMVSHIRKRTKDSQIMGKVAHDAFAWPFIPFTFSNALKKHTGMSIIGNYESMMDDLQTQWGNQVDRLELTDYTTVNDRNTKAFTDYQYPMPLEDGSVMVLRSGIGDIEQLVRINDEGKGKVEFTPGILNATGMMSHAGNTIVWNEFHFDPRWRVKSYGVIKTLNISTGESKTLTNKTRYAGAAISADEQKIVTVLNTEEGTSQVVVLNAQTGAVQKKFENEDNAEYGNLRWAPDGSKVVGTKITEKGKGLWLIDVESGKETELIMAGAENIGHPVMLKDYVLYNSPFTGIDNIYALKLSTGQRYQVTSSKYGAYNAVPSADGNELYYNDHTVNGLDVVKMAFDPSSWKPLDSVTDRDIGYHLDLVEQEGSSEILSALPNKKYEVKKYSKLGHALNLHSWGPFASTDLNQAQFGVFSRDVLSTTNLELGYTFDINERTGFASAGISYQGLFPVFDFEYQRGNRSTSNFSWNESTIQTGIRIPLLLTNSKYFKELNFENSIGITRVTDFKQGNGVADRLRRRNLSLPFPANTDDPDTVFSVKAFEFLSTDLSNGTLLSNDFEISFFNLLKRSTRDINSKWGQFFIFKQINSIGGDFKGATTGIRGALFFPGLFKNHSLFFRGGFQTRRIEPEINLYTFRNVIFKPRSFAYPVDKNFASILSNYSMPIWYPDISIGPLINFRRLKMNLFFDYGRELYRDYLFIEEDVTLEFEGEELRSFFKNQSFDQELKNTYISFGAEFTVDFNILRFSPEIEMGVRLVNKQANDFNPNGGFSVEFLIGTIDF